VFQLSSRPCNSPLRYSDEVPQTTKCFWAPTFTPVDNYDCYNALTFESVFQFNLVCDQSYLVPFASTVFMAGVLIGSATSGVVSDRYD